MADISTAVSMARVPILGEDGRISDDYIPAAIGEGVESAEAAATRAETAATSAEGSASAASQSAAQASGSATAAAESAASVADKFITSAEATTLEPGSQATASVENQVLTIGVPKGDKGDKGEKGDTGTGVPEGGTPGQLLSKTEDGTAWVDPPTGNVLTGTLGPAPILSADDAYATKPRRLTVFGNTRQNLWSQVSKTQYGITITANSNGSVTVSGTSTSSELIDFVQSYVLKPGSKYVFDVNKPLSTEADAGGFYIQIQKADGSRMTIAYLNGTTVIPNGFTVPVNVVSCYFGIQVFKGKTVSGTYRVMLNEGSTAQPWCPPGFNSVDKLSVVTAGKNLLNEDAPTVDGIIGPQLPPGDYILSGKLPSGASLKLLNGGTDGETITDASSLPHTFTADHPFTPYYAGVGGYATDLQLELGSTATAYEPPAVTTTPIDLDGHTLNSLPDGTRDELTIDATGAVTLTKRVCAVDYEASDFNISNEKLVKAALSKPYVGGVDFSSDRQSSDFAPIGNADIANGYPEIGVYTLGSLTELRGGTGTAAASASDQKTAFGSMLGSATWHHLYALAAPETIPLTPVTLPTLPAPNITVYNDSDVPSDITLEYERDVTIAFGKLAKQIAGTASAVAVREASTIEEE